MKLRSGEQIRKTSDECVRGADLLDSSLVYSEGARVYKCATGRPRKLGPKGQALCRRTRRWRLNGKFVTILALSIGVAISSAPLAAHHGFANYDTDKRVTLKGTVAEWIWSNPHCLLQLDASDGSGQVVRWVLETENPSSMIRSGWAKDSLKIGDQVTITVVPVKGGRPVGRIAEVLLPNGQKLHGRGISADPKTSEEPPKP